MSENTIRLLVVDDQSLIRQGIATLLSLEDDIEVVGQAENGRTAVELAETLKPSLILMDIRMPEIDGIEALRLIHKSDPACKIIMLTTFNDDNYIIKSLRAGACGYLLKDIPSQQLAQAVRLAHEGIYQLAPDVAGRLVGNISLLTMGGSETAVDTTADAPQFTDRELEVLRLLASGASNKEIAQQLFISPGTVKKYISNILQTLNLRDRTQAAIYAVKHNLA